jgi:nucleosome binding factor SPN SPT16 subunit
MFQRLCLLLPRKKSEGSAEAGAPTTAPTNTAAPSNVASAASTSSSTAEEAGGAQWVDEVDGERSTVEASDNEGSDDQSEMTSGIIFLNSQ